MNLPDIIFYPFFYEDFTNEQKKPEIIVFQKKEKKKKSIWPILLLDFRFSRKRKNNLISFFFSQFIPTLWKPIFCHSEIDYFENSIF